MPGALPDRAAIADSQLTQLRALLGAVLPANSFYARKLSNASLGPAITSLAEFFKHCPFTTKAELVEDQKNHPPFGTNLTFPLDQYTRCHQTSGSTGAALRWLEKENEHGGGGASRRGLAPGAIQLLPTGLPEKSKSSRGRR